jgi:hypothetical protein
MSLPLLLEFVLEYCWRWATRQQYYHYHITTQSNNGRDLRNPTPCLYIMFLECTSCTKTPVRPPSSERDHVCTVPEYPAAVCTDASFAGHFVFDPRFLFSPKNSCSPLRGHSAINQMLLALAHQLQVEENDLQPLPFHYHLKKRFRMRRIH